MSAIEEYAERKYQKGYKEGREKIILNLYKSGINPEEIAELTGIKLKTIQRIANE